MLDDYSFVSSILTFLLFYNLFYIYRTIYYHITIVIAGCKMVQQFQFSLKFKQINSTSVSFVIPLLSRWGKIGFTHPLFSSQQVME